MYNRQQIKKNAKLVLKRSYWTCFLVSLLAAILTGNIRITYKQTYTVSPDSVSSADQEALSQLAGSGQVSYSAWLHTVWNYLTGSNFSKYLLISMAAAIVLSLITEFFIRTPVRLGHARFYIATREQLNPVDFSYAFYGFKYNYFKKAWAYFSTRIIIWLWGLLAAIPYVLSLVLTYMRNEDMWMNLALLTLPLLIPSIIKSYQYKMVPYILSNNSNIGGKRARELSTAITKGNKWKLFFLDLSFIGWILLGVLACFVGILFVLPYINAARAEAYTCLKAEAMQTKGVSSDEELPSLIGAAT